MIFFLSFHIFKKKATLPIVNKKFEIFQTLNSISAEKNSTVIFPLPIGLIMVRMKIIMIDDTRHLCWGHCVPSDGDYYGSVISLVIPFCFRSCDKPDGELACWI